REVSVAPPEVSARVDAAIKGRADQDERLRQLELDLDPTVGTRTRTFVGALLGGLWTAIPMFGWCAIVSGHGRLTYPVIFGWSVFFLALAVASFVWARDTLTKTQLNRRLSMTVGLELSLQLVLAGGAYLAGMTPEQTLSLFFFAWCMCEV